MTLCIIAYLPYSFFTHNLPSFLTDENEITSDDDTTLMESVTDDGGTTIEKIMKFKISSAGVPQLYCVWDDGSGYWAALCDVRTDFPDLVELYLAENNLDGPPWCKIVKSRVAARPREVLVADSDCNSDHDDYRSGFSQESDGRYWHNGESMAGSNCLLCGKPPDVTPKNPAYCCVNRNCGGCKVVLCTPCFTGKLSTLSNRPTRKRNRK